MITLPHFYKQQSDSKWLQAIKDEYLDCLDGIACFERLIKEGKQPDELFQMLLCILQLKKLALEELMQKEGGGHE